MADDSKNSLPTLFGVDPKNHHPTKVGLDPHSGLPGRRKTAYQVT